MAATLWAAPPVLVDALGLGAVHGVADLPDLADQPFGAIASRAVGGFAAGLGLGWALVSRDGTVVPLDDLRLAADELARRAVLPPEADAWDGEDDAAC